MCGNTLLRKWTTSLFSWVVQTVSTLYHFQQLPSHMHCTPANVTTLQVGWVNRLTYPFTLTLSCSAPRSKVKSVWVNMCSRLYSASFTESEPVGRWRVLHWGELMLALFIAHLGFKDMCLYTSHHVICTDTTPYSPLPRKQPISSKRTVPFTLFLHSAKPQSCFIFGQHIWF